MANNSPFKILGDSLGMLGFTLIQIKLMLSPQGHYEYCGDIPYHNRIYSRLKTLNDNASSLLEQGFTTDQLTNVTASCSAALRLEALVKCAQSPIKQFFTTDQLVNVALQQNGWCKLGALTKDAPALLEQGFTTDQLIVVVSGVGMHIPALKEHAKYLLDLKFTQDQLANVASDYHGWTRLVALKEHAQDLLNIGFAKDQLTKVVSRYDGHISLKALVKCVQSHIKQFFTKDQLAEIASSEFGYIKLEVLEDCAENLIKQGFTSSQLTKASSLDDLIKVGSVASCDVVQAIKLKILELYCPQCLIAQGFTPEQLSEIVLPNSQPVSIEYTTSKVLATEDGDYTFTDLAKQMLNFVMDCCCPHYARTVEDGDDHMLECTQLVGDCSKAPLPPSVCDIL